jgi:hypothetical protein
MAGMYKDGLEQQVRAAGWEIEMLVLLDRKT